MRTVCVIGYINIRTVCEFEGFGSGYFGFSYFGLVPVRFSVLFFIRGPKEHRFDSGSVLRFCFFIDNQSESRREGRIVSEKFRLLELELVSLPLRSNQIVDLTKL